MFRIRELRLKNRLTQTELSKKLGVKPNAITQYESGARNPSADKLKKMAEIFGCTVDELFCGSDEK